MTLICSEKQVGRKNKVDKDIETGIAKHLDEDTMMILFSVLIFGVLLLFAMFIGYTFFM